MNESSSSSQPKSPGSLWVALALLTAALVAVFPLFAWVGYHRHGEVGVVAAALAGSIGWLAGASALVCIHLTSRSNPIAGVFGSMLFRMGLPLVIGLVLQNTVPALAEVGIFGTVLLYYLVTLAVETTLSVRMVGGLSSRVTPVA